MARNTPPRLALWMLRHFASAGYRESLAGDLIEAAARGSSRAWCWKQVLTALAIAPLGALLRAPWVAVIKAVLLALGVITLGVGTLSWASESQNTSCAPTSCNHSVVHPGH